MNCMENSEQKHNTSPVHRIQSHILLKATTTIATTKTPSSWYSVPSLKEMWSVQAVLKMVKTSSGYTGWENKKVSFSAVGLGAGVLCGCHLSALGFKFPHQRNKLHVHVCNLEIHFFWINSWSYCKEGGRNYAEQITKNKNVNANSSPNLKWDTLIPIIKKRERERIRCGLIPFH